MKIFLSGDSKNYKQITEIIHQLSYENIEVVYRWDKIGADFYKSAREPLSEEEARGIAVDCFKHIDSVDIVVFVNTKDIIGAGKWVELGYAIANNKNILVLDSENSGTITNFIYHPKCERLNSLDEIIKRVMDLSITPLTYSIRI